MVNNSSQNSITISREAVQKRGGMVILPLREYQRLYERAVPTFYLKGEEAKELDELVEKGLKEYEEGGAVRASSIREALKIYGKKNKKH